MGALIAKHLLIQGSVQGVAFRYSLRDKAESLGLQGWVRNLRDGRVEAVVEGPGALVEDLLRWAKKGPPSARVTGVTVDDAPLGCTGFEIRSTV